MNDEKLDKAKEYLDTFKSFEDFEKNYLDVYNPENSKFLTFLFKSIKDKPDVWQITKYYISTDTLRLDIKLSQDCTIDDIINYCKDSDLSLYKRIFIKLENKNYDGLDRLKDLGLDVYIKTPGEKGICTIEDFQHMREFFNSFKEQYNYSNLSTLEKVTLAYDHVKFFLYNMETSNDITDSRSMAKSMRTGNIICEAYSRIFCQLMAELGVSSYLVFIKENENDKYGHARVIVKIDDSKYDVKGVFVFDPTWDSEMNMSLVRHSDGTQSYESLKNIQPDDDVIETMPSSIRYLYFLIPLFEYDKYFHGEEIDKIQKFPTYNEVELTDELKGVLSYNDLKPRDKSILNILPALLTKTKQLEGYSEEDTNRFIENALNIVNQNRFGRLETNKKR